MASTSAAERTKLMAQSAPPISVDGNRRALSYWDIVAILLVLGALVTLAEVSRGLMHPLTELKMSPVTLDPANLPGYAARTSLR